MSKQHTSVRSYGVLVNEGQVALVRSSNPRHDPPLWWLPGGGIDFGEAPEDTLVREFFEETGLVCAVRSYSTSRAMCATATTATGPHGAHTLHGGASGRRTQPRGARHDRSRRVVRALGAPNDQCGRVRA